MEFSNPSLLYYLLLLVIPVIIHLFNFRKHKKIDFSSIHLLKQIEKTTKSKKTIKRWIVLLNRLSIISLIICAFALPYIKQGGSQKESTKIAIYIDNSFSMDRSGEKKIKLIDYAKDNAKKIIQELKHQQKVLIITNDFDKKHKKWYSPKNAISCIDSITISGNTENINTITQRYHQTLDTTDFNSLYIFSDFQKTDNLIKPKFSQRTSVKIGVLKTPDDDINISIDSCYFNNPIRKKNQIENLNILLTNHSSEDVITIIELIINEQQKSIHNIEIPANSKITHNLHYINPNETDFVNGLIKIDDQSITFDNKLYFSYSTKEKISICAIYKDRLSHYLEKLFSDSLFDFHDYNIDQIEYDKLNENTLIVLDQLPEMPINLSNQLKQYLTKGNNIFIFPHEHSDIKSYNKFFQSINVDFILKWIRQNNDVKIINYEHPIFKSTFDKKNKNINLPKVNARFLTEKNTKSQNRNILSFIDKSPFINQYIYNTGNIFMCFSDLNSNNNNFGKHAIFVPTLYNAALINFNSEPLYNTIEKETMITHNKVKKGDLVHLKNKEIFDMIPEIQNQNQKTLINFQNKLRSNGNYELIINKNEKIPISFNYNRKESKMDFFNKTEIKNLFPKSSMFILKNDNKIFEDFGENKKKNKIEYFFIISAIILLIIELILLRKWKI